MLQYLSVYLQPFWGPFRLLGSHSVLLVGAVFAAGFMVFLFLPKLYRFMPLDRGKAIAADGGKQSEGKPTGAGLCISLLLLPVVLIFMPFGIWSCMALGAAYLCMLFGYLDDASKLPWNDIKKGVLDLLVGVLAAAFIYMEQGGRIWIPLSDVPIQMPFWAFLAIGTLVIWIAINSTNCSDGIDGLAGSLALITMLSLAVFLYVVVGHVKIAGYLLIPHNPHGAKWAILLMANIGALAGYLWYNASPSQVMMGDAGSRLLGMLIGIAVLVGGNPFLVLVAAPMLLVNGGTGIVKIALLRGLKKMGFDTRVTGSLPVDQAKRQTKVVRVLHSVCFPLHDHFRKRKGWSNAQVLMRFILMQSILIPVLFLLLIKVR